MRPLENCKPVWIFYPREHRAPAQHLPPGALVVRPAFNPGALVVRPAFFPPGNPEPQLGIAEITFNRRVQKNLSTPKMLRIKFLRLCRFGVRLFYANI
jgi:hypothetical protein